MCTGLQSTCGVSWPGAKIMKTQNLIWGRSAHSKCTCSVFLCCLRTSKRKQASQFLGSRVSGEKSRASCTHPVIEESVHEQICLQNRAPQSLSLSATAGSIQQNKHTNAEESMGTTLPANAGTRVSDLQCNSVARS